MGPTPVQRATVTRRPGGYPNANNIPAGYATTGTLVNQFGSAITNDPAPAWCRHLHLSQHPALEYVWYHDHALGMTRNNVYAGPAGFWILRDPRPAARRAW